VAALAFCLSLPLWEGPKNISLAVALAALILASLKTTGGRALSWDSISWGVLAFACGRMLSGALSSKPAESLYVAAGDLRMLAAYVIFASLITSTGRARVASSVLTLSALAALLWAVTSPRGPSELLSLCSAGYGNNVGMYLALSLVIPASVLATRQINRLLQYAAGVALLILIWGLWVSMCRGAILGAVIFLATLAWLEGIRPKGRAMLLLGVAMAVLLAAGFLLALTPTQQHKLLHPLADLQDTLGTRGSIWLGAWKVFLAHPLSGTGPGNYRAIADPLTHVPEPEYWLGNAHQLFLGALGETGLIGFTGLVAFLLLAVARLRGLGRVLGDHGREFWLAASGAMLIAAVMGLVDCPIHGEHSLLLAALLGLASGSGRSLSRSS
jgi:O-antigen ligase